MKKHKAHDEQDPSVVTEKTDVDTSVNEGSRIPSSIGTGAPAAPTAEELAKGTSDPNEDMARAVARDTHARKEAAGEPSGQLAPEPVAMSNQSRDPSGPVPHGHKRMRAKGTISMGGRTYQTGQMLDVPEAEYESIKDSLEEV